MALLFSETDLGSLTLKNHLVMAPLTRCRAIDNIPNELMAEYYAQRAGAGLIITEGTSPSPNGIGYARIPGIYSAHQLAGWRKVTDAVHQEGGKVFMQMMHCGRVSHQANLPSGGVVMAPSAIALPGEMYTDEHGMQAHTEPKEMTLDDIKAVQLEYVQAAMNAVEAGFDGIELHAANGYLLEQFLRPSTNQREDAYGGSIQGRAKFVLEVVQQCIAAIGKDKVGIRLSPFGVFNDMALYDEMAEEYSWLAEQLDELELVYVHLADLSAMGSPEVPDSIKTIFRERFNRVLILSGGYTPERAEFDLITGKADLIAVGRDFLANPDLVTRWEEGAVLNEPDMDTFYTSGPEGYTDYPSLT